MGKSVEEGATLLGSPVELNRVDDTEYGDQDLAVGIQEVEAMALFQVLSGSTRHDEEDPDHTDIMSCYPCLEKRRNRNIIKSIWSQK